MSVSKWTQFDQKIKIKPVKASFLLRNLYETFRIEYCESLRDSKSFLDSNFYKKVLTFIVYESSMPRLLKERQGYESVLPHGLILRVFCN